MNLIPGVPESEFSFDFAHGMMKRVGVSFHKYGPVREAADGVDFLASARDRIRLYEREGNTEALVDAANFLMFEFMFPSHRDARYEPTDSPGSPGRIDKAGNRSWRRNDEL